MKKQLGLSALLCLMVLTAVAQSERYRVYFNDKGEQQALLNNPLQFLSPAAIERKAEHQISIDSRDLPVSKVYRQQLEEQGADVLVSSRWFNFSLVKTSSPEALRTLPFVRKVEAHHSDYYEVLSELPVAMQTNLPYGIARHQTEQVNGDYLHREGYLGQGMTIAVLDGGFAGAKSIEGLDSLFNSNRFKGSYSFVTQDSNVFTNGTHGSNVLSIMAGYLTDSFAGTAVKANYWLFTTEDGSSETPAEMINWLVAAEQCDSLGVDIITSSLGYSKFDGGVGDYDYDDMDGNTTLVTRAADMAASRGMLVVVSAGNEGSSSWGKITAPADGDSVLAIGAVKVDGGVASFSSRGPTYDGRIKPDVMALGYGTAYISIAGPTGGSGTSYACPVISGMAACLWQSQPTLSNMEIFEAIKFTADNRYTPNNTIGFGIANFRNASWDISLLESVINQGAIKVYPNPVGDRFTLELNPEVHHQPLDCQIFDLSGQVIYQRRLDASQQSTFELQSPLDQGTYILSLREGDKVFLRKIIR